LARITNISAREILDSRGYPTVEAKVVLENGAVGISSVPSGVSIGKFEAFVLLDNDQKRFKGYGVLQAVTNINVLIAEKLKGVEVTEQKTVDQIMVKLDATENKSWLGANAILAVSQAVCKAAANSLGLPLYQYIRSIYAAEGPFFTPSPMVLILEGGKHGAGNLDFQEFMVAPSSAKSYPHALQATVEIYYACEEILKHRNAIYLVGDEGGYAPNLFTNSEAFEVITSAISSTPYKLGSDVFLSLDVAASHFKSDGGYLIKDQPTPLSPREMIDYYEKLYLAFHLLAIEDPLEEEDWDGWKALMEKLGGSTIIVGDDLLVTNKKRLTRAIAEKACNAILIKPNQIGTVTETLETVKMAKEAGFKIVVSHRGGETNDDFLADLAVGVGADYVKFGAPARGERVVKYNRLLEVYEETKQLPQKAQ
jgi:enolase